MRKTCFKCGLEQSMTEFYRHPMMGDGYLGKCKTCTKRDVSENYRNRLEHYVAYEKVRSQRPARKAAQAVYSARRPLQKKLANYAVGNAIRDGRISPQPCAVCGDRQVQAHHDDYSKPLEIRWLCYAHHMAHHGKTVRSGTTKVRAVKA